MRTFITLTLIAAAAIAIALYGRERAEPQVVRTSQSATATLAPRSVMVALEGEIVFDHAPASNTEPYLLYSELTSAGRSAIKTKRLVFPATYACTAGDMPCSLPIGASPVNAGDRVYVEGRAHADVIYVERIDILP